MAEFNKVWVNCVEDESLYGRCGYFSDNIDSLKMYVTENNRKCYGRLVECSTSMSSFPFMREDDGECYRFFYHDPELDEPSPSSRIVTHLELSHWLFQGNGECCSSCGNELTFGCFQDLRYPIQSLRVRKWSDNDWHVPTADYLGLDS